MTRVQFDLAVRRIGAGMAVVAANAAVGYELIAKFPVDLTVAAANFNAAAGCMAAHRQQLMALLNATNPDDHDFTLFHLLLDDIEKIITDLNNLNLFALQVRDGMQPCREPGAPIEIARLVDAAKKTADFAQDIHTRAARFALKVCSHTAETEVIAA